MKINLVNDNPIIDKIVEKLEKNFHIILDEYEKRTNPSVYFDFIFWLKSCEKFYIFLGLYIIYIQVQKISGEDKNYDWEEVTKDKFPITHSIINSFNLKMLTSPSWVEILIMYYIQTQLQTNHLSEYTFH